AWQVRLVEGAPMHRNGRSERVQHHLAEVTVIVIAVEVTIDQPYSGLVRCVEAMSQDGQSAREVGISQHRRTIAPCFIDLESAATKDPRMGRTLLPPGRHESFTQCIVYSPESSGELTIDFRCLCRAIAERDGLPSTAEAGFRRGQQVQQVFRKFAETPLC